MNRLSRRSSRVLSLIWAAPATVVGCALTADDFDPELVSTTDACRGEACREAPRETASAAPAVADGAGTMGGRDSNEGLEGLTNPPLLMDTRPEREDGPIGVQPTSPVDAGGPLAVVDTSLPSAVGWASVSGLGVVTTTGGGASLPIIAETAERLMDLAARPEPLVIAIRGTLDVPQLEITSDKTLRGLGRDATLRGGIALRGSADAFVSNVIIQNINIDARTSQVEGDGIQVQYAHHVWIDHSAVHDAPEGLIDVVHGSDFVTISFTRFFYTDAAPTPGHRVANLIGHDANNLLEDIGHLNVTLHHNLWSEGVSEAVLTRFGRIHVFDNQFSSPGNASVLRAGALSLVRLENNDFQGVTNPHAIVPDSLANMLASGNVYSDTSGVREATGIAFDPDYAYDLEPATTLRDDLPTLAGPQ
jgi:pectate lyase